MAKVNCDSGNPSFPGPALSLATLEDQTITFDVTGSGPSFSFPDAETKGITVTNPDAIIDFLTDPDGFEYLPMTVNGMMEFPRDSASLSIDILHLGVGAFVVMEGTTENNVKFTAVATGVGTNPFGLWVDSTEYEVGDIVEFSGSFYQRINEDVSGTPPFDDPLTDTTNWQEISVTPNFTNFFATVDAGVASVKIVSMTGVSSADIGGFRISDPRGEPPIFLELDFTQLQDDNPAALFLRGTTNTNTFAPGAFHTVTEVPFGKASKDTTATLTPPPIPAIPTALPDAIP